MPEDAAHDRRGGPLPVASYSLVERQRMELPVEGKWPKAWRLLFVVGTALVCWAAIVLFARWL